MDRTWVALVLLLAAPALAGCASVAAQATLDSTPAYAAAVAKGLELDSSARLRSLVAFDGPAPHKVNPESLLAQESAQDGARGDGLANTWVAAFTLHSDGRANGGLEVQVRADGTAATRFQPDMEAPSGESASEGPDLSHWKITSQQAAAIARANGTFAAHVAEFPDGGYAYVYTPYSAPQAAYDWTGMMYGDHDAPVAVGWSVYGNHWVIQHADPAAGPAASIATAVIDASNGKLLEVVVVVPRTFAVLLDADETFEDPIPISPFEPPVFTLTFDVPEGTLGMSGFLMAYRNSLTMVGVLPREPVVELIDPAGVVVMTHSEFGFGDASVQDPAAGTWTVRVTHDDLVPGSTQLWGYLYGIVPEGSVPEE